MIFLLSLNSYVGTSSTFLANFNFFQFGNGLDLRIKLKSLVFFVSIIILLIIWVSRVRWNKLGFSVRIYGMFEDWLWIGH